jgi:hypothetical protein
VRPEELTETEVTALRRLLDRQAIVDCIHRYARGVDRRDEELLRSAYHRDAVEDHGAYIGPVDGLVPFLDQVHAPFAASQRYVTNVSVDIDGDTAHAESYWLCVLRPESPDDAMMSGGRYLDRVERREGGWRIARRVVVIDWQGTLRGFSSGPGAFVSGHRDRSDVSYTRPLDVTRPPRTPSPTPGTTG